MQHGHPILGFVQCKMMRANCDVSSFRLCKKEWRAEVRRGNWVAGKSFVGTRLSGGAERVASCPMRVSALCFLLVATFLEFL